MRFGQSLIGIWIAVLAALAPTALAKDAERAAGTSWTTDGKTLMEPFEFPAADRVIARAAELGYPGADAYMIPIRSVGPPVMVVRFVPRGDDSQADAFALVRGLVDIREFSQQAFVAMKASARTQPGREHTFDFLFWRDPWHNWRSIGTDAQGYFQAKIDNFGAIETPEHHAQLVVYEAALAGTYVGRGRISEATRHLEAALAHLDSPQVAEFVPLTQQAVLLANLLALNARGDTNDVAFTTLLRRYALLLNQQSIGALPIHKVAPEYPFMALRRGVEGSVLIEFDVDVDGRVRDPVVIDAQPPGLFDKAALASVRQSRYVPAVRDGKTVTHAGGRVRIDFKLQR